MINSSSELLNIIGETSANSPSSGVIFKSTNYVALGCNLRELDLFTSSLESLGLSKTTTNVFIAEVSLTYMQPTDADSVIQQVATKFPRSVTHFILEEQILPAGSYHPFARTMLSHFSKLNTPLNCISTYPSMKDQINRFKHLGYRNVEAVDLGQIWDNEISDDVKQKVENLEEFDEWEEFYLFCQHYIVLHASTDEIFHKIFNYGRHRVSEYKPDETIGSPNWEFSLKKTDKLERKFAAADTILDSSILVTGGFSSTRLHDSVLITAPLSRNLNEKPEANDKFQVAHHSLTPRLCHTITSISKHEALLVGGRTKPSKSLSDCSLWKHNASTGIHEWITVGSLPSPRSRHASVSIGQGKVLVFGGLNSRHTDESPFLLWDSKHPELWTQLSFEYNGKRPLRSKKSSAFTWNEELGMGVLIGGMNLDHQIESRVYIVKFVSESKLKINLLPSLGAPLTWLGRFGCQTKFIDNENLLVSGGVSSEGLFNRYNTLITLNTTTGSVSPIPISEKVWNKMPLLVGFNLVQLQKAASDQYNILSCIGGGAVCFSFGSCWNNILFLSQKQLNKPKGVTQLLGKINYGLKIENETRVVKRSINPVIDSSNALGVSSFEKVIPIESIDFKDLTESLWSLIQSRKQPIVFKNCDLGSCLTDWSAEYLKNKVGSERQVVVHKASCKESTLSFQKKNFKYETVSFEEVIDSIFSKKSSWKYYLRSLSADAPRDKPASLSLDFPKLSPDFKLPGVLSYLLDEQFSTPLRISSANTSVWLHYDVTSNVLCQVKGQKKVRLYPPTDIKYLKFPSGSTTSTIENVFEDDELTPPFKSLLSPCEYDLKPGDVLFLPPLWLHATDPIEASISINLFWKDLPSDLYAVGKDIYANRDIAAYEHSRTMIGNIKKLFRDIPMEMREFYLTRLAQELEES